MTQNSYAFFSTCIVAIEEGNQSAVLVRPGNDLPEGALRISTNIGVRATFGR